MEPQHCLQTNTLDSESSESDEEISNKQIVRMGKVHRVRRTQREKRQALKQILFKKDKEAYLELEL